MIQQLKEIFKYRELLLALIERELKVRYKQTLLGASWAIIQPLSLTLIFTFIFAVVTTIPTGNVAYPIFAYTALLSWTILATALNFASFSILNNAALVTKVYFPREILPLASISAHLVDFAISSSILVFLMAIYKVNPTFNLLFILPILAIELIFALGIALLFSSLVVILRDFKFVIPLLTQLWLFATPVVYSANSVPENLKLIYKVNPMVSIIENFRKAILGQPLEWNGLLISLRISIFTLIIGYLVFKKLERNFADVI